MAKISVTGNTASVISTLTKEQFDMMKKYEPNSVYLFDEDGNTTFGIAYVEGCDSVNKYGITFGGCTFGDGKMCCTIKAEKKYESAKEFIIEQVGMVVTKLGEVEKNAVEVLDKIGTDIDAICNAINVAE